MQETAHEAAVPPVSPRTRLKGWLDSANKLGIPFPATVVNDEPCTYNGWLGHFVEVDWQGELPVYKVNEEGDETNNEGGCMLVCRCVRADTCALSFFEYCHASCLHERYITDMYTLKHNASLRRMYELKKGEQVVVKVETSKVPLYEGWSDKKGRRKHKIQIGVSLAAEDE